MSLDGRIAAPDGTSRWITSPASRAHAHAFRATLDAIIIGTGTALTDDPALTARPAPGPDGHAAGNRRADGEADASVHQPLRVVVGHSTIPADARLRSPEGGELVQIATHDPAEVLAHLAAREVRHVLVEGGPMLSTAFLAAGLVDEVHAYIAPVLLGVGKSAVGNFGVATITEALRLDVTSTHVLGPDILMIGRPIAPDHAPRARSTDQEQ